MKPLDGIRVLDLSRVLAGPYATALMADLGAEIIKIEPPQGDDYRHIGPFRDGESALFTLNNRGKKSLVLNLKDPADLAVAQRRDQRLGVDQLAAGGIDQQAAGTHLTTGLGPQLGHWRRRKEAVDHVIVA